MLLFLINLSSRDSKLVNLCGLHFEKLAIVGFGLTIMQQPIAMQGVLLGLKPMNTQRQVLMFLSITMDAGT